MYACNCCNNRRGYGLFSGGYQPFWIIVVIAIVVIWIHCGCGFDGGGCGCEAECDNGCNRCC